MRTQRGMDPVLRALRCALGSSLFLIAAQSGLSQVPAGVPVQRLDAQVVGTVAGGWSPVPLANVDVLVVPSAATLQALGWSIDTSMPCTPESVATGAVYGAEVPAWIERGEPPPFAVHTHTDSDGRFHADVPMLEGPDQTPDRQAGPHVLLRARGQQEMDIAWLSSAYRTGVHPIHMEAARTLRGRIVDSAGRPISGAVVTDNWSDYSLQSPLELAHLLPPGLLPATALTDAAGCFELDGAYASWLGIAHRDFVPTSVRSPEPTVVDCGDFALEHGRTVTGQVIDPCGGAAACAIVWVHPGSIGEYGGDLRWQMDFDDAMARRSLLARGETVVVKADEHGRFELRGVTAQVERFAMDDRRQVDIHAAAPGFETSVVFGLDLDSDALDDVLVPLRREAALEVHVRDDLSGAPVTDAQVSGKRLMWPAGRGDGVVLGEPDGAGNYHVGHAGRYGTALEIRTPGHALMTLEAPGLAPGERRELEVRLAPESTLGGRVTTTSGAPIHGARVRIVDHRGHGAPRFNLEARADDTGSWTFPGLPVSEISVSVGAEGFASRVESVQLAQGEARMLDVQLPRPARLDVTCPPLTQLSASQRWIDLFGEGDDHHGRHYAEESPTGCSFSKLRPGRYTVVSDFADLVVVDLAEGEVRAIEITPHDHPVVHAQLSCPGLPATWLCLEARLERDAWGMQGAWARSPYVDADGKCDLELPRAGTWELSVQDHGTHQCWPAGTVDAAWDGRSTMRIDLPDRAWNVDVKDSRGRPLADVRLNLQAAAGVDHGLVTADARGAFVLHGLAPGTYRVTLAGGYPPVGLEQPVTIELSESSGGGDSTAHAIIPRGAAVSGAVIGRQADAFTLRVRAVPLGNDPRPDFGEQGPGDRCAPVVEGRYDLAGLESGTYRLRLESQVGPIAFDAAACGGSPIIFWAYAEADVTLVDDQEVTVDFAR